MTSVIDTYVTALTSGDAETALTMLAAEASLQSPFHTWPAKHLPSVFRARCIAFSDVQVDAVLRDGERAVVMWRATVDDAAVQAAELISVSAGAIDRVDVFIRPARALDAVERAMARAWPN